MPVGTLKNTLYGFVLPILGKRCQWKQVDGDNNAVASAMRAVFRKRHVVGACVQRFQNGRLTEAYTAGFSALEPDSRPIARTTVFRTASVAKMACALLVFRLQTLGKLSILKDVSDFLGYPVRNPHCPDAPITLGMLLGHTSSIIDSSAYFEAFSTPRDLSELLADEAAYARAIPGVGFRYSNLAAGMIGCMLEKRFGQSFEALMQSELFLPLGIEATFDLAKLDGSRVANGYRVLPPAFCFDARARAAAAQPVDDPQPERHYLLASGNLYLTAEALAKLALTAWDGRGGFLNGECVAQMQKPVAQWPEKAVRMRHGMGLLQLDDAEICGRPLWGHQGFAYGSVNGVFFDGGGNGFAMLNSGASEQRMGHLAMINRDLISLLLEKKG